jgi:hypothetical protein
MTVGELLGQLSKVDSETTAMIAVNGVFVPVVGVTAVAGSSFAVLRGKGKTQQSNRFTIDEEGVLGHLARLGLDDKEISEILGRPSESVKKKRKALGLSRE